jgi:hypothetical protein
MDKTGSPELTGLPWQIEILPDGHSRVFGLVPGVSTLQEAATVLGNDYELAVVENETSVGLEMYFSDYRAGLMTAKLVLAARTDAADLQQWQQRAAKVDYMASGKAKKYLLAAADRDAALQAVLRAIAFVPAVNLDDDILRKRFGEPAEQVAAEPGVSYYLYPEVGLAITLSADSKEVLQYVAPTDFSSLRAPLHSN